MSDNKPRYHLLEEYGHEECAGASNIVALTPQAAYALDRRTMAYRMLDDYYDEKEMRSGDNELFLRQLKWMEGIDEILKKELDFCRKHKLNAISRIYYFPLKFIVDHIIIEVYMLRKFLDEARPGEIIYVFDSRKRLNPLNLYHWIDVGSDYYKELLSLMAPGYGFTISAVDLAKKDLSGASPAPGQENRPDLKHALKVLAKKAFLFFKYRKYSAPFFRHSAAESGISALFLHSGCQPHDHLIRDFLRRGADVFVKEGKDVFYENGAFRKKMLDLRISDKDKAILEQTVSDIRNVMPSLYGNGKLIKWVSDECGLDVTAVLKPVVEYLFLDMFARDIVESRKLMEFYKKHRIDYVAARAGTDEDPITGLLAANCVNGVKSVCFEHSCSAPDFRALAVAEAGMFDIYFATDELSAKYFKEVAPRYIKTECCVFQEPYVFQKISDMKKVQPPAKKGSILYIPANHSYLRRYFNNMDYSATWYYRFQKSLVDFFASKQEFTFIFKEASGLTWCFESIIPYIKDRGYKNIIIETGRLPGYLPRAERAIIDCPSTPLFEAAAFGMPVLAVYKDHLLKWEPAAEHFGMSLQPFSRDEEAISRINDFISSDGKDYLATLPFRGHDTYRTLTQIKRGLR